MNDVDDLQQPTSNEENLTDPGKKIERPKQKKHHPWRTFGVVVAIIAVIFVVLAGWFGVVPGLSSILGANRARDLGVRYSAADLESYTQKTGIQFADYATAPQNPNKPGKKMIFDNPRTVDGLTMTQEELTAAVNSLNWRTMPLDNVQIRAGDGTVEVSGNLRAKNIVGFINFIGGVGYGQGDVDKAANWAMRFVDGASVYVNASVGAENDQLSFTLHEAKVGRFTMPSSVAENVLRTGLTNAITNADNYEIKSASFSSGQMNFSGTYPTTVYVAH